MRINLLLQTGRENVEERVEKLRLCSRICQPREDSETGNSCGRSSLPRQSNQKNFGPSNPVYVTYKE